MPKKQTHLRDGVYVHLEDGNIVLSTETIENLAESYGLDYQKHCINLTPLALEKLNALVKKQEQPNGT